MKVRINLNYILALTLIIALAFPVRIWWSFGPFASFCPLDVVLLTSLLLLLGYVLYSGKLSVSSRYVTAALIVPLILSCCSFPWSVNRLETIKEVLIYSEALSAFFISIFVFRGLPSKTIANMIGFLVFLMIFTAFLSTVGFSVLRPQISIGINPESIEYQLYIVSYHARLSHPYIGLSNSFATALVFFPVLFSAYAKATSRHIFHWLAFLTGLAVVLTMSRGVIMAMVVGYTLYAVKNRPFSKALCKVAIVAFMLLLAVSAYLLINRVALEQLPSRLSFTGITDRIAVYRVAIVSIIDRPVLGYGAGITLPEISNATQLRNTHNTFLQQILYFGVPGGCIVIGSILLIPFLIHNKRSKYMRGVLVKRGLVYAIITQILVFMVQASFEGSVLRVFFYFSIGISLALIDAMSREEYFSFKIDKRISTFREQQLTS